jgi:pimeloyl-ACP methyl ester carboxylesterase
MTTFVLVAGAWHAHRAWDRVAPLLRAAGASVVTPDLAVDPSTGLATHAAELVAVLDHLPADAGPVILVGHSYAGLAVRHAADRRPGAVSHLVLVEGWAGRDGESLLDLAPDWFGDAVRDATGSDGLIPAPPPAAFGIDEPGDAAWLAPLLRPHPLRTFEEPTRLTGAVDAIPGTGISCRPETFPFAAMAAGLGYRDVRIDGPHDVMVSEPAALTAELMAVSPPRAARPTGRRSSRRGTRRR